MQPSHCVPEITGIEGDREDSVRPLNRRWLCLTNRTIVLPFPTSTLLLPGPVCKSTEASHRDREKKDCATRDHRASELRKYRIPIMLNPQRIFAKVGFAATVPASVEVFHNSVLRELNQETSFFSNLGHAGLQTGADRSKRAQRIGTSPAPEPDGG